MSMDKQVGQVLVQVLEHTWQHNKSGHVDVTLTGPAGGGTPGTSSHCATGQSVVLVDPDKVVP